MDRNRFSALKRQRGVATLLIVLMVGLAVSVTVAATIYSLRGTQSQQLTTHSATAAQAAAWRGVEALRLYLLQVETTVWPGWVGNDAKQVSGLEALGVRAATVTSIEATGSNQYRVSAQVIGTAGVGSALTTATVEVIYDVVPGSGTPGIPPVCASMPKAPMVFNGNLDYSGGKLDVTNSVDYENIVVAGNLTIGGGSTARISGCVKGDVSLSGGGITDNGHLYSEGTIRINGMGNPNGTTLWARNVEIGSGVGGGSYAAIKAGAYAVGVYSGTALIGTAEVGGHLIASTVTGGTPWVTGTVAPMNGGHAVITLADQSQFLLDFSAQDSAGTPLVNVDASTGLVTGAATAERLKGADTVSLPDALSFRSTRIAGGTVGLATLTVGQLWGYNVTVSGWSGKYETLWASGTIAMTSGTVKNLLGGGDMTVNQVSVSGSGRLAGNLNMPVNNVQTRQAGTSPGLPGIPYCEARVKPVDADNFLAMANYAFSTVDGAAQLTIRNVKRANGDSIDGVYPLSNPSPAQLAILQELMTCNYTNEKGCLKARQSDGSWLLHGVTKMPVGVLWFDQSVKIDGTSTDFLNTVVVRGCDDPSQATCGGNVTLTTAGHRDLIAPNFAGAAKVCGGDFYPTNLCASRSQLVEWEGQGADGKPQTYQGLPIANTTIIAEGAADIAGWVMRGSVMLGKQLSTSGATVTIHGSLTVGSNQTADTKISAGGIAVDVPSGGGLNLLPVCSTGSGGLPASPASASVQWSRYL
jgi:hypothetical protein